MDKVGITYCLYVEKHNDLIAEYNQTIIVTF